MRSSRQFWLAARMRSSSLSAPSRTPRTSWSAYSRPSASPGSSRQKSEMAWSTSLPVASMANSICSAASRAVVRAPTASEALLTELLAQRDHLDRGHGRVEAFVACLGPGALYGLLDAVGRQDPERDRHAAIHRSLRDAFRHLVRNVVEVGRRAANDRAHGHDGVELAATGQARAHQRN